MRREFVAAVYPCVRTILARADDPSQAAASDAVREAVLALTPVEVAWALKQEVPGASEGLRYLLGCFANDLFAKTAGWDASGLLGSVVADDHPRHDTLIRDWADGFWDVAGRRSDGLPDVKEVALLLALLGFQRDTPDPLGRRRGLIAARATAGRSGTRS